MEEGEVVWRDVNQGERRGNTDSKSKVPHHHGHRRANDITDHLRRLTVAELLRSKSPREPNTEHLQGNVYHDRGLLGVTAGIGGLAAVDTRVLDDGVVNDEPGS
ncbi:hypothetical protein FQN60_006576 [Etheostoma spectabile]|uniref:Uncharacterized protein n=1 Tax=Etheostoma spectabile TaxID=54343 RepID=A0A5J5CEQ9_9PERO|nr:hypothetical protein FQN60_006576 [Etheostoma spectabile]